jgi:hypothetical protein
MQGSMSWDALRDKVFQNESDKEEIWQRLLQGSDMIAVEEEGKLMHSSEKLQKLLSSFSFISFRAGKIKSFKTSLTKRKFGNAYCKVLT